MFSKTHQSYGVNEVLLASVLGSVVFSIFAAQPLVIVGVTGNRSINHSLIILIGIRPNYCFQLHCLRHRCAKWDQLLSLHVLDWHMVSDHALDPGYHERLQWLDLRHTFLL
jgi:hypothetical protein